MTSNYTLDNSLSYGLFTGNTDMLMHDRTQAPGLLSLLPDVPLRLTPGLNGALSDNIDIKAPGVREMVPHPSLNQIYPLRSSLYDRVDGRSANKPPMPNWGDGMQTPSWLQSKWHQRMGSEWFEILQQTPVLEDFNFRDYGQFSVPYTGFSPLACFKPTSTLGWM